MNSLARPPLRTILVTLCALTALASLPLFTRIPIPVGNYVIKEINEAGHTALFFVLHLGLVLCWISFAPQKFRQPTHRLRMLLALSLLSFLGGIGIEWLQGFVGRDRSWMDVFRNLLGIIAADLTYWALQRRLDHAGPIRRWPLAGAALCFLLAFSTVFYWILAQRERNEIFPVLADFESPVTDAYMKTYYFAEVSFAQAPPSWEGNTSRAARLQFSSAKNWNGFMLKGVHPQWQDFDELVFEVFSEHSEPVQIGLQLRADGYRKPIRRASYTIAPGAAQIRYRFAGDPPIEDLLITDVVWFTMEKDREMHLWLDNVRLD